MLVVFFVSSAGLFAQSGDIATDEQGQIELLDARLRSTSYGWELQANADIQLSPEMRQGLNSGVPLHFIVDFRIKKPRAFWSDKTVLTHRERYSLIYYELTRHYRLQSLASGQSHNFRSLLAALEELGRLDDVQIPRPDNVDFSDKLSDLEVSDTKLFGALKLRLDDKALPLPLQPLFSSRWKLASEEFAWSLN